MNKFKNIEYLKTGSKIQKEVYYLLLSNEILDRLKDFDPIVVGSISSNTNILGSDVDIICYWTDCLQFKQDLISKFKHEPGFKLTEAIIRDELSIILSFTISGFNVEIFGQNIPTKYQFGYQHLLIGELLLREKGESFRQKIINLKQLGYKTQEAFCISLGIQGDPYKELLNYSYNG